MIRSWISSSLFPQPTLFTTTGVTHDLSSLTNQCIPHLHSSLTLHPFPTRHIPRFSPLIPTIDPSFLINDRHHSSLTLHPSSLISPYLPLTIDPSFLAIHPSRFIHPPSPYIPYPSLLNPPVPLQLIPYPSPFIPLFCPSPLSQPLHPLPFIPHP